MAAVPVVAVTAKSMLSDVKKAEGYGFYAYVTKPVIITELFAAIDGAAKVHALERKASTII